jgi:hypothetical protein
MYFVLKSAYRVNVLHYTRSAENCPYCNRSLTSQNFVDNSVIIDRLRHALNSKNSRLKNQWPMSLDGGNSLIIHENVAEKLFEQKVKGLALHKVFSFGGEMLSKLPPPPPYYRVEPLGKTHFVPSPDEFEIGSCICMTHKKEICDFKSPFVISQNIPLSEDFFKVYPYQFFTCVSRKVIEILIQNEWVNDFIIGDRALPGMRITQFGETWYEDALKHLRSSFPETMILE